MKTHCLQNDIRKGSNSPTVTLEKLIMPKSVHKSEHNVS